MSVAIIQRGALVWEAGLGKQDVEANINASADTPFYIGALSQIFGSTLLLQKCLDQDTLELSDRITRWVPYPDAEATVRQLLSHQNASGAFAYDPSVSADSRASSNSARTSRIVMCSPAKFSIVCR